MNNQTEQDDVALQVEIERRQAALEPVFAERERLNSIILAENLALEELRNQRDLIRIEKMGAAIDWKYLLDTESGSAYEERNRRLNDVGFCADGIWSATRQTAVRFRLTKGSRGEVDRACAFVRQILPAITAHPDGYKWFSVMEESLSEHGSYHAKIDEAKNSYVVEKTYYSTRRVFETDTLEKLVQYLHDEVYYDEVRVL